MRQILTWALVAVVVAGCDGGGEAVTEASATSSPAPVRVTKVLTVIEENHDANAALSGMPYLASLARSYGRTSTYHAMTHPSLPNYLAMAGGSTFGVHDDGPPSSYPLSTASVFDAAIAHGHTAATYAEGMTQPCQRSSSGPYAVKHNPWAYFASAASRRNCAAHDLPAGSPTSGALHDAIVNGLPDVTMVVPDLCHDGHDCSLGTADRWLQQWLPRVMDGPDYRAGRLAIVVTFDEGTGSGDHSSTVLTVVVSPKLHGKVVSATLNHLTWCKWMTNIGGSPPLQRAAGVVSLGAAFGL